MILNILKRHAESGAPDPGPILFIRSIVDLEAPRAERCSSRDRHHRPKTGPKPVVSLTFSGLGFLRFDATEADRPEVSLTRPHLQVPKYR